MMEKSMWSLVDRYRRIPGETFFAKVEYAVWRKMFKSLVKRGVLYRNGEVDRAHVEPCPNIRQRNAPRKIICVTGFGHSGSGVVSDLLSEYEGVSVQGLVDANGSLRRAGGMEFDFLRHAGGLFDIEHALQTANVFIQDSVVKSFMALVASYYYDPRCFYREMLLLASRKFLDEIVDYIVPSADGYEFSPHLRMLGDRGYDLFYGSGKSEQGIFALRKISVDAYRALAKQYVVSLLSEISTGDCLLLDQVVSDYTAEIDRYKAYLGPIKLIAVYRDPRDVFATGIKLNEHWIPHDARTFVQWYERQLRPYQSLEHSDFLFMRFENLVTKYTESVSVIENFIGISASMHVKPYSAFDPSVSINNIGLHRTFVGSEDVALITQKLKDFCFNG